MEEKTVEKTAEEILRKHVGEVYWNEGDCPTGRGLKAMQEYAILKSASLKAENDRLREALKGIDRAVDNQNPTHEEIWRIAYDALSQPKEETK